MRSTHESLRDGFTAAGTRASRGFTLIELLVVIAIIGILASIVLASLGSARAKGRDAKRLSDIKQLQVALELYTQDHSGKYPATLTAANIGSYVGGGAVPVDPGSGAAYFYSAPGAGVGVNCNATSFHLGAILENTNPALSNDADQAKGSGTVCTGGALFEGNSSACGAAVSSPDLCYDVTQ